MDFRPGKLYNCPDYFLLIYPSKEKAMVAITKSNIRGAAASPGFTELAAMAVSIHWTKELKCHVRYSKPDEVFMFLERDGNCFRSSFGDTTRVDYFHILFGDKTGWVICADEIRIREVQK